MPTRFRLGVLRAMIVLYTLVTVCKTRGGREGGREGGRREGGREGGKEGGRERKLEL